MADCYTTLYVRNVTQKEFAKWFEKETDSWPYYDSADGWDFYVEVEGGYGGYFWESLALKMVTTFKGIVFEGNNQIIWDDHIVSTSFGCDGKEVVLIRSLELPSDCDDEYDEEFAEELEDMRALWEAENNIPYGVTFSVDDVFACIKVYKKVSKKLKDAAFVESVCSKHKLSQEKFLQFVAISDFKTR